MDIPEELSDNEIDTLLKANGGNKKLKKRGIISMDQEWRMEDGSLLAHYMTIENVLLVATKECMEIEAAKKKAEEKKALDGF